MNGDTFWSIVGVLGVVGLLYQAVTWISHIKKEEEEKEPPRSVVYRN